MWIVLDQFSRTLIDAAVANAILLTAVVVVMVFTRQPARRILLAQTGVYASLAMFPLIAFDLLPRRYPVDWCLSTGLVPPPLTPEPDPAELIGPSGRAVPRDRPDPSAAEWPAGERLVRVATLLYLAGASIGLTWFGLGVWGFRRIVGRSGEATPEARRIFGELIVDLGRSPPQPALRTSARLRSPVLGGVTRPTIVIPAELDEEGIDPEALRLILLHELAHADRGDAWFNALASLAQILWFFLPHLWWLRGQLRIDQEFLADRKAAGPLGEATHYARWLVGLSGGGRPAAMRRVDPVPAGPARPWGDRSFDTPLLQRVAMLLYCPFVVEGRPPRWFSYGVPAAFMAAAVVLSTLRILAPVDPSALAHRAQPGDPVVRSFQVEEFVVLPAKDDAGRAAPYNLLLPLPPNFRLEAKITASPRAMAQVKIAGCPLIPESSRDGLLDGPATPHFVAIRRNYRNLKVSVDGLEFDLDPRILDAVHWLTVTPADQIATIRQLVISW